MDNLASLLKAPTAVAPNQEVKNRILELIQSWATAAEGRSNLIYINEVYRTLQREGYHFPPKVDFASSMFDSSAVSHGALQTVIKGSTNVYLASGVDRL